MASQNRKSFLSYEPITFSLTDGTNIPPPQESPPSTANGHISKTQAPAQINGDKTSSEEAANGRVDSFQSPTSPRIDKSSSPRQQGVRRLFSLSSLRSSFSSSRQSLAIPKDGHGDLHDTRPLSPSASFTTAASHQPRPQSRASTRKGGSWFKRKSGMWSANGDNNLASIGEDGRPTTRENKRLRDRSPAPLLPEINKLSGGSLSNGEVDWDDKMFKKPT